MPDEEVGTLALVLAAFRATLRVEVRPDEDFFDLGGDSVASEAALMHLEEATGLTLPGWTLLDHPTARSVAAFLERQGWPER